MKIKTRLTITNAAMILISLAVLLAVCGAVLNLFERQYYRPDNITLDSNSENVASIIESADEYADYDALAARLGLYDYRLYVFENERLTYTNGAFDIRVEHMLNAPDLRDGRSKCMVMDGATVAGAKYGDTMLVALKDGSSGAPYLRVHERSTEIGSFSIAFVITGVISIIVIFALSRLYSRRMVKRVMEPVELLRSASDRVQKGDYSQMIFYEGSDEFSTVTASFNRMQRRLLEEKNKARLYEKSRTDMIAGISHDLRTPLTSIRGYIKGISDGVADTPEKQKIYLDTAYKKTCEMEALLEKLFYFSKLQTGNLPLKLTRLDLNEFLRDFTEDVRLCRNINAELASDNLPHFIKGDREQLSRVLENLLDNAVKYADADRLKITVRLFCEGEQEVVEFSDNGRGVPDIMLDSIFECFFRCSESRGSSEPDGSGLGLYIVKYITEAHKGSVCAESDNGLIIKLSFPREDGCEQDIDS